MSATPSALGDYLQTKILNKWTDQSFSNERCVSPSILRCRFCGRMSLHGYGQIEGDGGRLMSAQQVPYFCDKAFCWLIGWGNAFDGGARVSEKVETRGWRFRGIHSRQSIRIPCSSAGKMLDPGMVTWYDYRQPTTLYEPQAPTPLSLSQIGQKSQIIRRAEFHVRKLPPLITEPEIPKAHNITTAERRRTFVTKFQKFACSFLHCTAPLTAKTNKKFSMTTLHHPWQTLNCLHPRMNDKNLV
jgi:hypothetical protein